MRRINCKPVLLFVSRQPL